MVKNVTDKGVKYAYQVIALPEIQDAVYDLLAPGGHLVSVHPSEIDPVKRRDDVDVAHIIAGLDRPEHIEVGKGLYANLTAMLESGKIKVSFGRHIVLCYSILTYIYSPHESKYCPRV